jgi:hypothetical protein
LNNFTKERIKSIFMSSFGLINLTTTWSIFTFFASK